MDPIAVLDKLEHPRILVVGDVILDRYMWGEAERVSPEAPVMVLRAKRREFRLGGAASVASLLRALDVPVSLAGVVGGDGSGRLVHKLLSHERIDNELLIKDTSRPTTSKSRFMGWTAGRKPHQILRVDRENRRNLSAANEKRLGDGIAARLDGFRAVLVSDYGKGTCTPRLLGNLRKAALDRSIPVFVDPARIGSYGRYRRLHVVIPNRAEAEMASGCRIRTPDDAVLAARTLSERYQLPTVVVKLDSDGMVLHQTEWGAEYFPTRSRSVCDVTGAGDTVLAMLALCRLSGIPWQEAIPLANVAAGLQVERLGVSAITRLDLRSELMGGRDCAGGKCVTRDALAQLAAAYRQQRKTLVFTNGCFDLLHVGHVTYLQEAAGLGDILVVAVNSDESVRRLKGAERPVIPAHERAAMLAALGCVDHVILFEEDNPLALIRQLRPEVLVKGTDYSMEAIIGRDTVEGYGGKVVRIAFVHRTSTTAIVNAVRDKGAARGIAMAVNPVPSGPLVGNSQ